MLILVQNITDNAKSIYRFTGTVLAIEPYDFVCFDTQDDVEIAYWTRAQHSANAGLRVVTDTVLIRALQKLKDNGKLCKQPTKAEEVPTTNTTEPEQVNEPAVVAEVTNEPEEVVTETPDITTEADDVTTNTVSEPEEVVLNTTNDSVVYTEEYLETLKRADLIQILTDKNISYKKNGSVNALINAILTNQSED